MGRVAGVAGFEPTNAGIKIRCLNLLATPHYYQKWGGRRESNSSYTRHIMVRLKRFELLTHGLEGRCSIRLSYKRMMLTPFHASGCTLLVSKMERVMGIGPTRPAWKAGILPLNYTRIRQRLYILPKISGKVKCFFRFFPNFFTNLHIFLHYLFAKKSGCEGLHFKGIIFVFCHIGTFLRKG